MKTTKVLFGILIITAALAMNGRSQVYQLSVPISGYMTMSAQDLNGPSGSSGVITNYFNTLSETIYLDTVSNTLRQVGTVFYTPSATNIQFYETQAGLSSTVTVDLGPSGGNLSFDTGPQIMTWDTALSAYTVKGDLYFPIPISGSYSLVTGGRTYTGSFAYTINDNEDNDYVSAYNFYVLSLTNYPSSLQLSGLGVCCPGDGTLFPSPGIVADVKATNGFEMKLSPGIEPYWWPQYAPGEIFIWSSQPVTANLASNVAPCAPYSATVTATVVDGFVVAATVTDGGCGYTNTPLVSILGGGGSGATATAVVTNGVVVGITITDAGIGYTSTPIIYINSPLGAQIALIRAVIPAFSSLSISSNYQLQVSSDLSTWTNQGSVFTATNPSMIYPGYFNLTNLNRLYFRLQAAP